MTQRPSTLTLLGYGSGSMVLAAYFLVTASFLFYATAILGLSPTIAGLIMAVSTLWDAVIDLPMGWLSDHTRSRRFGRRHLYLILGGLTVAACSVLLWSVPRGLSLGVTALWLALSILALKTALTVFVVPHTTLGVELSPEYDDRALAQGYRAAFQIVGMVLALVGSSLVFFRPSSAYPQGQLNPHVYAPMGWACAVLVLTATLLTLLGTWRYIPQLRTPHDMPRAQWREFLPILHDRNLRSLLLMILVIEFGFQIGISLGFHTYTYTYHLAGPQIGMLTLILLTTAALSQPFWIWISRRFDKKPALYLALLLAVPGYTLAPWTHVAWHWFPLAPANHVAFTLAPFMVLAGAGTGAFWSLPYSMIGDCAQAAAAAGTAPKSGSYIGLYIFAYKLGTSLSIAMAGMLLRAIGYHEHLREQAPTTRYWLAIAPSLLLLLIVPVVLLAMRGYRLQRKSFERQGTNFLDP